MPLYEREELVGQKVTLIIPDFIARVDCQLVRELMENGRVLLAQKFDVNAL